MATDKNQADTSCSCTLGAAISALESLVIDVESDHNTQDTAKRVAKMYLNEV